MYSISRFVYVFALAGIPTISSIFGNNVSGAWGLQTPADVYEVAALRHTVDLIIIDRRKLSVKSAPPFAMRDAGDLGLIVNEVIGHR